MRYFLFGLISLLLISCGDSPEKSETDQMEELLEDGKWEVSWIQFPMKRIREGIKFSSDKQVFYIDSQGKVVPTYNEIVYELKGDTLRITDFKYESRFLFEKGTLITLIESFSKEQIKLKVIHPKENIIILKKEKM